MPFSELHAGGVDANVKKSMLIVRHDFVDGGRVIVYAHMRPLLTSSHMWCVCAQMTRSSMWANTSALLWQKAQNKRSLQLPLSQCAMVIPRCEACSVTLLLTTTVWLAKRSQYTI